VWINFTWFASAFDTDDWLQQLLTMVQMIGAIILALGIPTVFESIDDGEAFKYTVVAAEYVVMRVSLIGMWLRVAIQDPANRRVALRYAVFNAVIQAGRVTVAFLQIDNVPLAATFTVGFWAAELAGHPFATRNADDTQAPWQEPRGTHTTVLNDTDC